MESKVSRRYFLATSAVAAVGVALAACGATPTPTKVPPTATNPPAGPTPTVAPTAVPTRATVELVIARYEHTAQPILQDAPAHVATSQATGVKLNFQVAPEADFVTKQKLWMSTKQVPDVMRADFSAIRDYAGPSVFQPVLPLIDKYGPNLKKYLSVYPNDVKKLKMNGDLFIIPATSYNTPRSAPMPCIRKDLLDKVGMPLPADFDQLYQTLKALKAANPGFLGWTCRKPAAPSGIKRELMIVAYPFGSGMGGWSRGVDVPYWDEAVGKGQWLYGPIHPEFKDVLAYFNKLYKEQLLDPDVANTTADQWHEKNSSNKGFFSWDNYGFCSRWNLALRANDPKLTWTPFPIIKGTKGARENDYSGFAGSMGGWCIGANCKYPDRAIQLLDWKLTPLGLDTSSWGVEGTHYTLKGTRAAAVDDYSTPNMENLFAAGTRVLKQEVFDKYKTKTGPAYSFMSDTGTGQLDFGLLWDDAVGRPWDVPGEGDAWWAMAASDKGLHSEVFLPSFTADENAKCSKILMDIGGIIDPAIDKVVLGQSTMADWDKAVQDCIKAGAQDMEKIYNDAEARG